MHSLPSIFTGGSGGIMADAASKPYLSKKLYELALGKHANNISNEWVPGIGRTFGPGESYFRKSLKRVRAEQCQFLNCSFERSAGPGSIWRHSTFEGANFSSTNFQYADFSDCIFVPYDDDDKKSVAATVFEGSNFSNTSFERALFERVSMVGSSFTQADFSRTTFEKCEVASCSFEGAVFDGARLKNLKLNNANIEYVDFSGCLLENVSLSIMQFPFVLGLLPQQVMSGQISISTDDLVNYPNGVLPWDDLLSLINELVSYYEDRAIYFPIANLYFVSGDLEKGRKNLELGLRMALEEGDYRDIKHLCFLAKKSQCYKRDELIELYQLIELGHKNVNYNKRKQKLAFNTHIGEIRQTLLRPIEGETTFAIHLRLRDDDAKKSHALKQGFLNDISQLMELTGVDLNWQTIEYSEHSPPIIVIKGDNNSVSINQNAPNKFQNLSKEKELLKRLETLEAKMTSLPATEAGKSPPQEKSYRLQKRAFMLQTGGVLLIALNFLMSHGEKLETYLGASNLESSVQKERQRIKEKICNYTDIEEITLVVDGKIIAKSRNGELEPSEDFKNTLACLQDI